MPKVSAAYDPLLERLIFAYDGTSYRVVKCDTDGNVVAALKAGQSVEVTQDTAADLLATVNVAAAQTIEVTQDTAADLKATVNMAADQNVQAREYGWIGAAWQKQPLMRGYSSILNENVSNLDATAGLNYLNSTAVPAGELHLVELVAMDNINTATSPGVLAVTSGGMSTAFARFDTMTASRWYFWTGILTMAPGDNLVAEFNGCASGDDLYLRYHGFKIDIDQ